MAKEKLLDTFLKSLPRRDYVVRYYNAGVDEIPEILKKGVVAKGQFGGERAGEPLLHRTTMTSANRGLLTGNGPLQVEMELPKSWYVKNATDRMNGGWIPHYDYTRRHVDEPYLGPEYPETWRDKQLLGVDDGGRLSNFDANIPRQFVKKIYDGEGNAYDVNDLYGLSDWELSKKFRR